MQPTLTRDELAAIIDHTLLTPQATRVECEAFLDEAVQLGVRRVCISPTMLAVAREHAAARGTSLGSGLEVVTVVGFPNGAHETAVKVREAELALAAGAAEIDAVANLGMIKGGEWDALGRELSALRAATAGHPLKIILETACLTDDEIVQACLVAHDAGCDFVKTSTGFHPAGGASVHAVELMARTVGETLGVKASGGIRTAADARAMLDAGATRLGLSATAQVLAGWNGETLPEQTESTGY